MSDSTHEEAHTGPIKTPTQLFWVSLAGFAIPIFLSIGLASFISSGNKTSPGETDAAEKIAARIQKVGTVEIRDANRPLAAGEEVYKAQCVACHGTGVSGAPKLGDAGDWAARLGHGYDALLTSALKGKGAMAPQGGGNYSDAEIGRAVVYMANAAGGKFADPGTAAAPAKAEEASAATPAAAPAAAAAEPTAPATMPASGESSAAATVAAATTTAAPAAASTGGDAVDVAAGKALYEKACVACHAAGVAGAPKLGDKAAWAPRIAEGMDAMMNIAIHGKGAMPPRGASTATDAELRNAVEYMVQQAK